MPKLPGLRTNYLAWVVGMGCIGLIVLERLASAPLLRTLTNHLWSWVIVLAACAALLGVFNVVFVHCRRVLAGSRSWANSLLLVATALAVFVIGLAGPGGSRSPFAEWVFAAVLAPGMATLFALLAFFTVAAGYRYLRVGGGMQETPPGGRNVAVETTVPAGGARQGGGWMLAGALLFLLLQTPMINALLPPAIVSFAGWVLDVPAMATLRGALLGSSIALVILGVRLALASK